MISLTVSLLLVAFIYSVASFAGKVHPAVAVLLLVGLEALLVLPVGK